MKKSLPFLVTSILPFLWTIILSGTGNHLFGQVHIEPSAPRICLGDSVLLRVVADDPGNIPTFFSWTPTDSLSSPMNDSTFAYPTDTITYFVETNAGGASVTVYVIPEPNLSFTSLAPNFFCQYDPPITLVGSPAGGIFFTDAPSGFSGNIFDPSMLATGSSYNMYYALTYGDTSMCMDTVSQNFIIGATPNAAFTGLNASYCSNDGIIELTPAEPGGVFSTNAPGGALTDNLLDLSLVPTGTTFNITYSLTQGDPPCSASTTQSFIVQSSPFAYIENWPGGTFCTNLDPIALEGAPTGGVFFTDAPSGLVGNLLTPANVPTNVSYTVYYAYTSGNGCADTAAYNLLVLQEPTVSFSGLLPVYCAQSGIVTVTGDPAGGFFSTDIPGLPFGGDVLDIDLSTVPVGTTYHVAYYYSAGGDPPCAATSTQSFIISTGATAGFSGLPGMSLCSDLPPITLTGTPPGGVFFTDAPSGLVGNVLTPANVPFGPTFTVGYIIGAGGSCPDTASAEFFVVEVPPVSFSGLDPEYCEASGIVTLVGDPAGGSFTTDIPGITFSGDVVDLDLSLVALGVTYSITYTYSAGGAPPCTNSDTHSFIINGSPGVAINGLPGGTLCTNIPPITLTGVPAGGVFSIDAPSGLVGNILTPANVPTGIPYILTYTYTAGNGCVYTATANIFVEQEPTVSFTGLSPVYCEPSGIVTVVGSPAGGFFSTDIPGLPFGGDVLDIDLSLVTPGTTYSVTYYYSAGGDPPCSATETQSFVIQIPAAVSFTGLPPVICANTPPITLVGNPPGGTFTTGAPSGLSGNILTPADVPPGNEYSLTYTYIDVNGCPSSSNQSFFVNPLPVVDPGVYAPVCTNAPLVSLSGSPAGGVFSGTGVSGNTFNPAVGTQTITYTYTNANGCTNSAQTVITVNPLPVVDAGTYTSVCTNSGLVTLTGTPSGGVFSGTGVSGNTFNPAVGTQTITYTFTNVNGCTNSDQTTIVVNPLPVVNAGTYGPLCENGPIINLSGSPSGGVFSGTGVIGNTFDPSVGTQVVTYTYTNANGCTNSAQTTITVNPAPVVNAGTYAPVCINAAPVNLSGSPVGGVFSGTGVSGNTFNPAVGTQTITYTYTNANGCTNSAQTVITVNTAPVVNAGTYAPVCISAGLVTLSGTPAGGVFSGTGVTGNTFNPAAGTQTITYTFTNAAGCTNTAQTTITVNPLPVVDAGTYPPVCEDVISVTLTGTPSGGVFSGTGVTGNSFDPSVGTQTITYTYTNANGCTNTDQTTIVVNPLPVVDAGNYGPVCSDAPDVALSGVPLGGTFIGVGVTGNFFDPSVGTQTIQYFYSDSNGCFNFDETTIVVNAPPVVNAGTYAPVCIDAPNVVLSGSPAGGVFEGVGVSGNSFDPSVGTQTIIYSYTDINGCSNSAETVITVNPLPVVDAGTYPPVCADILEVVLTGAPAGGVFSGTGVSGNIFNPAVGTQTITYTYTDANGCTNTDQTTIVVNPLPVVDAGNYGPVCSDAPDVILSGTPLGGTFVGVGVTGNLFDPSAGTQTIQYYYSDSNGCFNFDETTIVVNAPPVVDAGTYAPVCIDAPNVVLSGNPSGGAFEGVGVSGNSFDPSVGTQTIIYSYTDVNGCSNSDETVITVNPLPVTDPGTYPPVCADAAEITLAGSPAGGVFSGTGVSGNSFDPAFGSQTITYTYTDGNGCTNAVSTEIIVNPLPVVDAGTYAAVCVSGANVILTGSPSGGEFVGIGVSANSFDPSVGTQTIQYYYTDNNGCFNLDETTIEVYPLPTVDAGTYPNICVGGPLVPLVGTPAGGVFSGTGVSGNTFNPSVGTQVVTYTYTDISGCTNSDQTTIVVNPLPAVNAATYPPICDNAIPLVLTGTPAGGTFSGTGVTGNIFDPSVGTQTITYSYTDINGCSNSDQTLIVVNSSPIVSAGNYPALCLNSGALILTGTPVGGTFSGTGVTGILFNPAVGTQTITYTYSNANGCQDTDQVLIQVNPIPSADPGVYAAVCADAPEIILSGTPGGGSFSGVGVSFNTFDPDAGTQTITYTVTQNGCTNSGQTTITVYPLPVADAGMYAPVCIDAPEVPLSGSPAGGVFSGTGVTGSLFDPSVGNQVINYFYTDANGCSNSDNTEMNVNPLPVVDAGTYSNTCLSGADIPLTGIPEGGVFSGAGVTAGLFDPSVGTQTISYTYTDPNGCTNTDQAVIQVDAVLVVSFSGLSGSYCANAGNVVLSGSPAGGEFTTSAPSGLDGTILSPSFIPPGGPYTLTYTYSDGNGCSNTSTQSFTINPLPAVQINGLNAAYCVDANPVNITGLPAGGLLTSDAPSGFSGSTLTPASVPPGVQYLINYTYTDGNGCTGAIDAFFQVNALPVVDGGTYPAVCVDAAPVMLSGTPAGGVFSGTGVSGDIFDPQSGSQTITYTYTDANGCTNSAPAQINVNPLPVVGLSGLGPVYCSDEGNVVLAGLPTGGNFSADIPGVLINGGNTFVPSALPSGGGVNIIYTYQDAAGCTGADTVQTTVNVSPDANLSDTLVLCGQSGQIAVEPDLPGQSYLWSDGQTTGTISVVEDNTYTVTVTAANGCTSSDSADVFIYAGQQFISNLLVSGSACTGDTVHFFDISEVLTGVDSYFWQFGDGAVSTERDPTHIYTSPGIFNVTLTATSQECQNISLAKPVQIQTCKQGGSDDIFDLVQAYPNPAEGAFRVDISLVEKTDVLVTLSNIQGNVVSEQVFRDQPWYQVQFTNLSAGIYFVHIQGETKTAVLKVLVF